MFSNYFLFRLQLNAGGGLPIRRHSSIGPQERRGSAINLSPPTVSYAFPPLIFFLLQFTYTEF